MENKIVTRRECDAAMARKKRMYSWCNKNCKTCVCCIETDQYGNREHTDIGRSGIAFRDGKAAILTIEGGKEWISM